MPNTVIAYDPVFLKHQVGPGHPESSQRVEAVIKALEDDSHLSDLKWHKPRQATEEEIRYNHVRSYVKLVQTRVEQGFSSLSFPDTGINSWSWEAALSAAGAVLDGVDMVMQGKANNVFCPVRPPGHHARPAMGMGFCLFNNIALGGWYAWDKYQLERILIIDWDAHHGNGTQEVFYDYKEMFFFSVHQDMWYPFTGNAYETGEGAGRGTTMNIPLGAGTTGQEAIKIFTEKLLPAMDNYRPELVLISAGFDALKADPLCRLEFEIEDFSVLTEIAMEIADKYAQGRIVSALEGGYDLNGLAKSCAVHVKKLAGK
ncbi:MAG: histone deacetylase [Desulfonatronovibrio sp.]